MIRNRTPSCTSVGVSRRIVSSSSLVRIALPVLGGEAVQGHVLDAAIASGAHGAADGLDALAMPGDDGQVMAPGPAAIAIHHDGDVARYRSGHR
jgi:hypothetical protein